MEPGQRRTHVGAGHQGWARGQATDRSRTLLNLRPSDIDDLLAARAPTEISRNARRLACRLARRVGRAIFAQQEG